MHGYQVCLDNRTKNIRLSRYSVIETVILPFLITKQFNNRTNYLDNRTKRSVIEANTIYLDNRTFCSVVEVICSVMEVTKCSVIEVICSVIEVRNCAVIEVIWLLRYKTVRL